jgi:hypothetical protein
MPRMDPAVASRDDIRAAGAVEPAAGLHPLARPEPGCDVGP